MNKKTIFTLMLGAFAVGSIGMVALQSRAQSLPAVPVQTIAQQPVQNVSPTSKAADNDSIDNENGGPEKPDAVLQAGTDKETNDDSATSTVSGSKQSDAQEHDSAANPNEAEDGN